MKNRLLKNEHTLFNFQQLDVENKCGIGGNTRQGLLSVCKAGGNSDTALTTGSHAGDTNIPAFDDFSFAELECEGLAFLVCYKKKIS